MVWVVVKPRSASKPTNGRVFIPTYDGTVYAFGLKK